MTVFTFADNVNTTLASPVSSSATSFTLASTAHLPTSIPTGEYLVITFNDAATRGSFEVIYVGAISGATCSSLLRGQEGTTALSWLTGDFAYNGPTAGQMANILQLPQATGRLLGVQTFLASGTYTPSSSLVTRVVAKVQGGGGGSAGAPSTTSNSVSCGGPGSGGAYSETFLTSGFSGLAVTVGGGGAGSGSTGGNGGLSSFGGATAAGGFGGSVGPANVQAATASASGVATASGGTILNDSGAGAGISTIFAQGGLGIGVPGQGGGGTSPGSPGTKYGTGGGGVINGFSSATQSGFSGAGGYVEIWEYS